MSKIHTLFNEYGQSIWLDYIDRNLLVHGGLKTLVAEGIRGVTSNPTIFQKAIGNSADYDEAIRNLLQEDRDINAEMIYQRLTVEDVQMAADILNPIYDRSVGADGFVSLEVSPHLAFNTEATIRAARHLWQAVDRPNLMIKVPGTVPGLPAIEKLIAEGINVNVTLLFSVERYKAVIAAYICGLSQHPDPKKIASVASFFVSRVDSKVDTILHEIGTPESKQLKGRIAIANAKMAYQHFKEVTGSASFEVEHKRGARPQRPLWASTSTKNQEYSDVLYIEQLIGPNTVNTVPPDTLDAFQTHGTLNVTLESEINSAQVELETLASLGIDLAQITEELEQEGVRKFTDSYDKLLAALEEKCMTVTGSR